MKDTYYFGICKYCGEHKALKNGSCEKCKKNDTPDFMKNIFGDLWNEREKK